MPPKARPTSQALKPASLQAKRKEKEDQRGESSAKRMKKNTTVTKEKEDALPHAKPITPKKCVINLQDAVMKVSPETYINPTARKLFNDVVTLDDFRVAARMFWITYSAYSRAVTPQVEDNLLKMVSDDQGAYWHEKGEFKLVWHDMYAAMVRYYVEKVKFYGDKYMNSPAGMALKATIVKSRKRHLAVPVVNEESLFNFAEAEGLHWSIKEVEDFYVLLADAATRDTFESTTKSGTVQGEWFTFDVPQLASANHADSWFDRLSAVAINLIIQWVRIHYGFSTPGARNQEPNDTSCELLLAAIPTPPISDGTYPPFEVDENVSISELLDFQESDQLLPVTATDAAAAAFHRAAEEIADIPNPLSGNALREAVATAEKTNLVTIVDYEEALNVMPSPPFTQDAPVELRGDPTQVTPAKMYAINLTATDLALFTGNTETKVQIVKSLAEQELEGWRMFGVMAEQKFAHWENQIKQLEAYQEMMGQKREEAGAYAEKARDVHEHVSKLEEATEGVRHFRFANETYGQLQHTPHVPKYMSGRPMPYMQSPGQGSYPMYYPMPLQGNTNDYSYGHGRASYPPSYGHENSFASPSQFPPHLPPSGEDHFNNPSPPSLNPLQKMSLEKESRASASLFANPLNFAKKGSEKESRHPGNIISRTGTPNNEKDSKLLPSPEIRTASRQSVTSQHGKSGAGGDNDKSDDDDDEETAKSSAGAEVENTTV